MRVRCLPRVGGSPPSQHGPHPLRVCPRRAAAVFLGREELFFAHVSPGPSPYSPARAGGGGPHGAPHGGLARPRDWRLGHPCCIVTGGGGSLWSWIARMQAKWGSPGGQPGAALFPRGLSGNRRRADDAFFWAGVVASLLSWAALVAALARGFRSNGTTQEGRRRGRRERRGRRGGGRRGGAGPVRPSGLCWRHPAGAR